METQLFYGEEMTPMIADAEQIDEWNRLVTELGCEGQTKLAAPEKSPIPFMALNNFQQTILKTLCPRAHTIEKYSSAPIPLQVLAAAALCKKEQYFERLEIWADDQEPDPVLVGMVKDVGVFLIARWGAERLEWDKLHAAAVKRAMQTLKAEATKGAAYCKQALENLEATAERRLRGDWIYFPQGS